MIRNTLTALSLATLTTLLPIKAEEKNKGIYFAGSIGAGQMSEVDIAASSGGEEFKFETGFSGEVGVGYDFGSFRTEFSYSTTNFDIDTVQGTEVEVGVDVTSFFLSAAYDFRSDKKWQPYISGSYGNSSVDLDDTTRVGTFVVPLGDKENISTFKVKLGVNYQASDDLDVFGEIWGQGLDDFTIGGVEFGDVGMGGASLGLRVKL